jgi:anti-anti-sigma factor
MFQTGGRSAADSFEGLEVLRCESDVVVLALSGELDIARTPRLRVAISEVLRTRPAALVIDLCQVTFADSTALALLLNAQRRAAQQETALLLACDVPRTLDLLALTRLNREFEIHASRDEAVRAAAARHGGAS